MFIFDLPNDILYYIFSFINIRKYKKEIWWWYLPIRYVNRSMLTLCINLSYDLDSK